MLGKGAHIFSNLLSILTSWQYTTSLKQKEQEEKEARLNKLRPAIRNLLKGNPNVFHYTTFPTADKLFHQHPIWQMAKIESERKLLFEEYVNELKEREVVCWLSLLNVLSHFFQG